MIITLGQAKEFLAEYAGKKGKCAPSETTRLFVMEVVQQLLHRGANGNLRKWCFHLCDGCFTAPSDMEVPLRVKIDGYPNQVWSKWYEFYDVHSVECESKSFKPGLYEEPNTFFTIYDLPTTGARIAPIPLEEEGEDAYIIIQGEDVNGRDVFTYSNGVHIHGEKLPISREKPVFSRTVFSKITGIEKSRTCNHVRLYWQTHEGDRVLSRGLLSEYRPNDLNPSYKRFRVPEARCDCCVKVEVIGRVKLLDSYHDNDVLPITNIGAMRSMAMTIQSERTNNIQEANFHNSRVGQAIEDENQYHKTGQDPFDFILFNSPGGNENLQ
jgi:hypothetical protein